MAMIIRQSTSIDVAIGPFLDETDGKTAETGLTLTQPDIRLKKNGGAWAQKAAAQTLSHEEAGWYELTLDATDTNTVGQLIVAVHESGALPVWREFCVLEEAIYDALLAASATGLLPANVTQWLGSAPETPDVAGVPSVDLQYVVGLSAMATGGRPEVNATHWGGTAVASANVLIDGAITAAKIASDAIQAAKIQDGALSAAKFASGAFDAVWSVAARLLTAGTNIVLSKGVGVTGFTDLSAAQVNAEADAAIETYHLDHLLAVEYDPASKPGVATALLNELVESDGGVSRFTANALEEGPGGGSAPTAEEVADAVWDEAIAGHAGAGSTGEALAAASSGSAAGPGAIAWVVEVDDGTDPIEGAHVWVSTDEAGDNVVAGSLITDSFGLVTFMLDAGTYYVRVRKDGFNPIVGDDFVVS
jgi:hypothetical protein